MSHSTREQIQAEFTKRNLPKDVLLIEGLDQLENRTPAAVQQALDKAGKQPDESLPDFLIRLRAEVPEVPKASHQDPVARSGESDTPSESERKPAVTTANPSPTKDAAKPQGSATDSQQPGAPASPVVTLPPDAAAATNSVVASGKPPAPPTESLPVEGSTSDQPAAAQVVIDPQPPGPVAKPAAVREPPARTAENTLPPPTGAIALEPPGESRSLLSAAFSSRRLRYAAVLLLLFVVGVGGGFFARNFSSWATPIAPNPATSNPDGKDTEGVLSHEEFLELFKETKKTEPAKTPTTPEPSSQKTRGEIDAETLT